MTQIETVQRDIPRMATISEAAEITGTSYHFIRRLCLEDRIIYVRSGKKFLVNLDRLVDFFNGVEPSKDF